MPAVPPAWCTTTDDGVVLRLRVQPGARRTEVQGILGDELKIRLAAPAVEGKANAALLAYLAERLHVPRSAVTIVGGSHSRSKKVLVAARADPVRDLYPERR
jgi:uncharacterized protein (TIGR00251 family)